VYLCAVPRGFEEYLVQAVIGMKSLQKGAFCEGMATEPRNCPVIATECDCTAVCQLNAIMAGDVGLSKQVLLVTDSDL